MDLSPCEGLRQTFGGRKVEDEYHPEPLTQWFCLVLETHIGKWNNQNLTEQIKALEAAELKLLERNKKNKNNLSELADMKLSVWRDGKPSL